MVKPKINNTRDQYLRKNVVTRRIETSSSSSGYSSGHSGGHGGSHRSSSGKSAMAAVAIEDKITKFHSWNKRSGVSGADRHSYAGFSFHGGRSDGGKQ